MKKSVFFTNLLLVGLAFASCQQATGKNGENGSDNSVLSPAEIAEKQRQDSIAVADSLLKEREKMLETKGNLTLAFTGDVLMGTNFPDSSSLTSDRGRSLFKDCSGIISKADIAIGNLEGACYYGTKGEISKRIGGKNSFIFRMPGDHAQRLVDAGFDAMGTANNHAGDFGPTGRRLTAETLRKVGLACSGQKGIAEDVIIERDGVKYGYLAFAASCGNTLDLNNDAERDKLIKALRPKCDILVITFHGGAEGSGAVHVPRRAESFLGENRGNVYKFAHECIDLGADIVVGHGPHVPRAMELYKGHLIAYSLGNFCAPFKMSLGGPLGLAPLLWVEIDAKTGEFVTGKIHSLKQVKGVGPRKDESHAAARHIANMTKADFPESGLNFADDGTVTKQ